jgi:integrase/recombinase XerC
VNKPSLTSPIEVFLDHLRVERRLSSNTGENYRRDLLSLAEWMQSEDIAAWRDLRGEQLRSYIASEHRRGLGGSSLQRRLSACRSFFQWLLKHGELTSNPAQGLRGRNESPGRSADR